ncbi:MAG TPA: hypothetical protein VJZ76_22000 [Thermoanaerobaculia bacterium]|nr:hypothetical protein [Thermoanaerobaculia bacterium]
MANTRSTATAWRSFVVEVEPEVADLGVGRQRKDEVAAVVARHDQPRHCSW